MFALYWSCNLKQSHLLPVRNTHTYHLSNTTCVLGGGQEKKKKKGKIWKILGNGITTSCYRLREETFLRPVSPTQHRKI